MTKIDLQAAKTSYQLAREQERKNLAKYLAEHLGEDLRVVSGGRSGKGLPNYTSGRRIAEHDLSDWKWVTVKCGDDFECVVSLNMPDVDPRSGNWHFLFDRVGLLVSYHKDGHYYETAIYPNINLPLDDKDTDLIIELIIEQYKIYCGEKEA